MTQHFVPKCNFTYLRVHAADFIICRPDVSCEVLIQSVLRDLPHATAFIRKPTPSGFRGIFVADGLNKLSAKSSITNHSIIDLNYCPYSHFIAQTASIHNTICLFPFHISNHYLPPKNLMLIKSPPAVLAHASLFLNSLNAKYVHACMHMCMHACTHLAHKRYNIHA